MTQLEIGAAARVDPAAWNPYWLAFARAHGRHPAERGMACAFILWMSRRWQEWRRTHGKTERDRLWPADHAAFSQWLSKGAS